MFEQKRDAIASVRETLDAHHVSPADDELLTRLEFGTVKNKISLFDLLRRPDVSWENLLTLAAVRKLALDADPAIGQQIELAAKYDGYIKVQQRHVEQHERLESLRIPIGLDYAQLKGLSYESIEKLTRVQPETIGQASRVPGVRPSDIALLIGHLR